MAETPKVNEFGDGRCIERKITQEDVRQNVENLGCCNYAEVTRLAQEREDGGPHETSEATMAQKGIVYQVHRQENLFFELFYGFETTVSIYLTINVVLVQINAIN